MSKISQRLVKAVLAAAVVAATGAAFTAQETRSLAVTATVPGGCTLTTSGPMAFGTLDMSSTSAETHQVTVTYKCASGVTASQFLVGGQAAGPFLGTMTGLFAPTPDTIAYNITWPTQAPYTGEGFNVTGRQVVLVGTIPNNNYISKKPDAYADSVLLAVNF